MTFHFRFAQKPPVQQFLIFILLSLIGFFFAQLIIAVILLSAGALDMASVSTPLLLTLLATSQLFLFLFPALFFAYYYDERSLVENLTFKSYNGLQLVHYFIALGLLIISLPFVAWLDNFNKGILFFDVFKAQHEQWRASEQNVIDMIARMVRDTSGSLPAMLVGVLSFAVLPAICEELFFRQGIQRIFMRIFKRPLWAILCAGFLFSLFHMQPLGLLPRFFLGVLLGYIYFVYKSILPTMVLHAIFNGSQMIMLYVKGTEEMKSSLRGVQGALIKPTWESLVSLVMLVIIIIFLSRRHFFLRR